MLICFLIAADISAPLEMGLRRVDTPKLERGGPQANLVPTDDGKINSRGGLTDTKEHMQGFTSEPLLIMPDRNSSDQRRGATFVILAAERALQ